MCRIVKMELGNRSIMVAELKKKYIENIIDAAGKCDLIDRIILFGSSTEERCREESDIDLAVFGNKTRSQAYRLKSYDRFVRQIYGYDFDQNYDLLYFQTGKSGRGKLFSDIEKGEILYEKNNS